MHLARCLVVVAALLVPTIASAEARHRRLHRTAHLQKKEMAKTHECRKEPVEVVAARESATFALAECDGTPDPRGVDELSILARPAGAAKPKQPLEAADRSRGAEVAPGIHRIDSRLVERLEQVVDHFRKPGISPRIVLVSGYRPRSSGSYHAAGRALDFRLDGVPNLAVLEYCKTLPDTGCGYYPNSVFVHVDVRDPGTGHVAWIDVSRPGESPKYVTSLQGSADQPTAPADAAPASARGALPALPAASARTNELGEATAPSRRRNAHPYFF